MPSQLDRRHATQLPCNRTESCNEPNEVLVHPGRKFCAEFPDARPWLTVGGDPPSCWWHGGGRQRPSGADRAPGKRAELADGCTRPPPVSALRSVPGSATHERLRALLRGAGLRHSPSGDLMYISVSRLRVDASRSDDLIEAFRDRSRLVEASDGFVDLEVWRSDRDPEEVWMVSRWRERACFTAYMRSDEHARSHARIPEALAAA